MAAGYPGNQAKMTVEAQLAGGRARSRARRW